MVPDVPRNESGNIDGTVLMQYVIDYILDLELQLDGQGNLTTAAAFTSSFPSKFVADSSREPLSEKTLDNIVASHYEFQVGKVRNCSQTVFSDESTALVLLNLFTTYRQIVYVIITCHHIAHNFIPNRTITQSPNPNNKTYLTIIKLISFIYPFK